MKYLILILIAALPLSAAAQNNFIVPRCNVKAGEYRQKQAGFKEIYSKCGDELIKEGWGKVTECNGHQWFYILRLQQYDETLNQHNGGYKDVKPPMFCEGVDALAGSEESPCVPLNDDNRKIIDNCYKGQTR
jgi:hypothetical protein